MSATLTSINVQTKCPTCSRQLEPGANYCSECAGSSKLTAAQTKIRAQAQPSTKPVPSFASINGHVGTKLTPAMREELGELQFQVFRQRVFLAIHWGAFLVLNLTGVGLAIKCYLGVYGDESTKLGLALVPMFYINLCALVFVSYIKSTKKELQHLNQKLSHLRFRIEYGNLL